MHTSYVYKLYVVHVKAVKLYGCALQHTSEAPRGGKSVVIVVIVAVIATMIGASY